MASRYLLTARQWAKRSFAVAIIGSSGLLSFELQRQYIVNRSLTFDSEYLAIRKDSNFYHTLHEQVSLGYDEKVTHQKEIEWGIKELR
jgi:hypothetical protein